ncbi:NUDIX hydrolase, partial [candidate division WOR-3 bacterium]|nr:NUDIX hydrolase [candidate division WOR-3 bacterium]
MHKKAVAVVPVLEDGFVLIRQFRYAANEILWEIPAGIMEDDETPAETAVRELIEETGFRPEKLEQLCRFYTTPGFSNEEVIIFYSQNLIPDKSLSPDPDENIEKKVFSHSEVRSSLKNGL